MNRMHQGKQAEAVTWWNGSRGRYEMIYADTRVRVESVVGSVSQTQLVVTKSAPPPGQKPIAASGWVSLAVKQKEVLMGSSK